jgi:methionine-rich copper-binding protein CopC
MFSRSSIISSLIWIAAICGYAAPAGAHAYPAEVTPADGVTITAVPREVRIRFTEGVELEFSRIEVKSASGEKVAHGKLRRVADDTLSIDLKPLNSGNYIIEWQVLSVDTHITEGVLRFTVRLSGR